MPAERALEQGSRWNPLINALSTYISGVELDHDRADEGPVDGHMRGALDRTATGSYQLRPFGQPCIEGYFGGRFARDLEESGDGALAQAAIDEVVNLLGTDFRKRVRPLVS